MNDDPSHWYNKMWLAIAALCLGASLLLGCEPVNGNNSRPEPTRTPIQYGTPK